MSQCQVTKRFSSMTELESLASECYCAKTDLENLASGLSCKPRKSSENNKRRRQVIDSLENPKIRQLRKP